MSTFPNHINISCFVCHYDQVCIWFNGYDYDHDHFIYCIQQVTEINLFASIKRARDREEMNYCSRKYKAKAMTINLQICRQSISVSLFILFGHCTAKKFIIARNYAGTHTQLTSRESCPADLRLINSQTDKQQIQMYCGAHSDQCDDDDRRQTHTPRARTILDLIVFTPHFCRECVCLCVFCCCFFFFLLN